MAERTVTVTGTFDSALVVDEALDRMRDLLDDIETALALEDERDFRDFTDLLAQHAANLYATAKWM